MQVSCSSSAHHQVGCGRSQPVEEHSLPQPCLPSRPGWVLGLRPWLAYTLGGWAAIPIPKVQGCAAHWLSIDFKIFVVSPLDHSLPGTFQS